MRAAKAFARQRETPTGTGGFFWLAEPRFDIAVVDRA
jgi:hypothetical protein